MKKALCLIIAAAAIFACGCAKRPSGEHGASPSPTPKTAATEAANTQDNKNYDNAVTIVDGVVTAGSFDWQFFLAKVVANKAGDIRIISTAKGATTDRLLSFTGGAFTVSGAGGEREFGHIVKDTIELPAGGTYTSAEVCILTDDAELTAEGFFEGLDPAEAYVGLEKDGGMVIFVSFE
ncbi:MAG: hypothetical protein J5772_00805 [Clostridia bacterium]|nr:hypothetical protein [Clostridia bacterium]